MNSAVDQIQLTSSNDQIVSPIHNEQHSLVDSNHNYNNTGHEKNISQNLESSLNLSGQGKESLNYQEREKFLEDNLKQTTIPGSPASGTRVFKKSSPNNKITAYLGKRDFIDHLKYTDPVDGVILVDPEYVTGDVKVWASILAAFRYGREDLDVLGLTFRKDLYLAVAQIYPPVKENENKRLTRLQERLIKKLGPNAYPFYFEIPSLAPASVILQPAPNDTGKPCGVDYELKCFAAPSLEDKPLKKSTVRLAIRKLVYAPDNQYYVGAQPHVEVTKDFLISPGPLQLEISLDKKKYYHGEPIAVNVQITNNSSKTIKKIRIAVRQYADICLFSTAQYKCNVAELESDDGFPLGPCCNLSKVYYLTPLLSENRDKRGLALDGKLKHEDTNLASSTIYKDERNSKSCTSVESSQNRAKERENLGIIVRYTVKVKLIVAFGQDVSAELGFVLTHPPPPPSSDNEESSPKTQTREKVRAKSSIQDTSPHKLAKNQIDGNGTKKEAELNLIEFNDSRRPSKAENGDDIIFEDFTRLKVNESNLGPDILNDPPSEDFDRENNHLDPYLVTTTHSEDAIKPGSTTTTPFNSSTKTPNL